MSDNKKKALLNESTTRRFWKLAGLKPIHEKAYMFEEEEDLEEGMGRAKEDEDVKEEGMDRAKEDEDEVDEVKAPQGSGIKGVYDMSDHGKGKKKKPGVPKKVGTSGSTVQDVNEDDLGEMGMPPAAEDEMGAEEPMPEEPADIEDEGPEDGQDIEVDVPEGDVASLKTARDILDQILSAVDGVEEPEMDMDDDLGEEEPEMDPEAEALEEIDQEELEEVAERIASRVAKRIAESLKRK